MSDQTTIMLEQARAGIPSAQHFMGLSNFMGLQMPVNRHGAVLWWEKAAEQNFVESQFLLAQSFQFGLAKPPDLRRAAHWYERAAANGHEQSQINFATMLLSGQGIARNPARAAEVLQSSAERGSAKAAVALGRMLEEEVVGEKPEEAERWFRLAADAGDADGQYSLAVYLLSREPQQHAEEILDFLRKAADQACVLAQFELGRQFIEGAIVKRDKGKALDWLTAAAKAGHPAADLFIGKILLRDADSRAHVDSAAAEALGHFETSAVRGNVEAAVSLGMAYWQGQIIEKNLEKAEHWLKSAAKTGDPQSQFLLGNLYLNDLSRPVEAFTWNNLAGQASQPNAQYNVALQLHYGLGTPQQLELAMQWYRACMQNSAGELHERARAAYDELKAQHSLG